MAERVMTIRGLRPLEVLARELGPDPTGISSGTITATADWQGKLIRFSAACTVTIPSDLPEGFSCGWSQDGTGVVTFVAGSGETLQSLGNALKSAGQYAVGGITGMGPATHRVYGQLTA